MQGKCYGKLLIVPEGIEMAKTGSKYSALCKLLIVPEGIEIMLNPFESICEMILLIVPEGIEMGSGYSND